MKTFKIGSKTRAELEHKLDVARDTLADLEKREADPAQKSTDPEDARRGVEELESWRQTHTSLRRALGITELGRHIDEKPDAYLRIEYPEQACDVATEVRDAWVIASASTEHDIPAIVWHLRRLEKAIAAAFNLRLGKGTESDNYEVTP